MKVVERQYVLALPAGICRRVAKFCCDLAPNHQERERLLKAAALFMRQSDGLHSEAYAEVEAPLHSFLWLQKRLWTTSAKDAQINRVCVEISKQMGEQEFRKR